MVVSKNYVNTFNSNLWESHMVYDLDLWSLTLKTFSVCLSSVINISTSFGSNPFSCSRVTRFLQPSLPDFDIQSHDLKLSPVSSGPETENE